MNKYITPLLTFCALMVAQDSPYGMEAVIKNDTYTGTPKQKVPETAKAELLRLLDQPFNPEEDQESSILRIEQLKNIISTGSSDSPPITPPRYISNQDLIVIGNLGKGHRQVTTEMLINLGLTHIRQNGGTLTPSDIERAAKMITEGEDPNP